MHYRWTMKELKETSNKRLIQALISERKSSCTNYYSPLYKRLTELEQWVERNIPLDPQILTDLYEACKYALSVFESMPEEHAERLADIIDENIDLDVLKQAIAKAEKDGNNDLRKV